MIDTGALRKSPPLTRELLMWQRGWIDAGQLRPKRRRDESYAEGWEARRRAMFGEEGERMERLGRVTRMGHPTCPWCGTESEEARLDAGINRQAGFQRWQWTCDGCGCEVSMKVRRTRKGADD